MKIFVLTPIYATETTTRGATPVVHYFAREWVKLGHEVTVFHIDTKFPSFMYWIGSHFKHQLNTRLGILVPVESPNDADYVAEGVKVHKICLKKIIPHSRFSKKQIQKAFISIVNECIDEGAPDWFVGHWDNPQLELLDVLKKEFGKKTCLVLHSNNPRFERLYGETGIQMLNDLDAIGFRSMIAKRNYEKSYGSPEHSFIAASGVSESFIRAGIGINKIVEHPIQNFVFVGSLIERKYPSAVVTALSRVYPNGDFTMTYIGDGAERSNIEEEYQKLGRIGTLKFTGRIPRDEIIAYLTQADVFVMISRAEIFGLVYLEAMALGVIPIGSRDEGIDGIITDGENGFLCKAGDVDELSRVLLYIKQLSSEKLSLLSQKAKETALKYSDESVAKSYIGYLSNLL